MQCLDNIRWSTTSDHEEFLATMLTGKGNLDEEVLFPSMPAFEGTMAELLSELEYTGGVFLTTLCTSVN